MKKKHRNIESMAVTECKINNESNNTTEFIYK